MRDCENGEMRDQLPDWVHERLDADRARWVAAHVAGCADCTDEVALLRDIAVAWASATPHVNVSAIVAALPKPPARAGRQVRWYQRTQWRAAAALLVTTGVTSLAVLNRAPNVALDTPTVVEFAGGVGDLSDNQLKSLLKDIEKLDAMPVAETDGTTAISTDFGEAPR